MLSSEPDVAENRTHNLRHNQVLCSMCGIQCGVTRWYVKSGSMWAAQIAKEAFRDGLYARRARDQRGEKKLCIKVFIDATADGAIFVSEKGIPRWVGLWDTLIKVNVHHGRQCTSILYTDITPVKHLLNLYQTESTKYLYVLFFLKSIHNKSSKYRETVNLSGL